MVLPIFVMRSWCVEPRENPNNKKMNEWLRDYWLDRISLSRAETLSIAHAYRGSNNMYVEYPSKSHHKLKYREI